MKKFFLTLLSVVVVLIVGVLIFAATRPDSFRVERTLTVQAPPEKVFALINNFHGWGMWSPWDKLDPDMKRTFSGPDSGVGAAYAWEGNSKVGSGRMQITESVPSSKVAINLDFIKPFEGHNISEFTLQPSSVGTKVTWAMYGPSPYVSKLMSVFISMDSMIGKDFESGLGKIKEAVEKAG